MIHESQAIVLASLAADALALGAHWIYDTRQIDDQIGRPDVLRDPLSTSFHKTRTKGDFTHYGDQTLVLLKSLVESNGFVLESYSRSWRQMFEGYTGYRDQASKSTLTRLEAGLPPEQAGSPSSDLGGAARIAPLVFWYREDENTLAATAREQTAMTHQHRDVVDSAAFFSRVGVAVLEGRTPDDAVQMVTERYFNRSPFQQWVSDGISSRHRNTREVIGTFGQACGVDSAFPSVIHLISKYSANPREGLIENVRAGGDSAARGMLVGMIFGAAFGMAAVSDKWVQDLNQLTIVESLLGAIKP